MSTDVNFDSEASQITGGYSMGFSLTVLQVIYLISALILTQSFFWAIFWPNNFFSTFFLFYQFTNFPLIMCSRVNANNLYVRFFGQPPRLHLQMPLYKLPGLQARFPQKIRGK